MRFPILNNHEIEMRLGYTPCICGVLDGTWHPKCYIGKTKEQAKDAGKRAFRIARAHLKAQDKLLTNAVIEKAKAVG